MIYRLKLIALEFNIFIFVENYIEYDKLEALERVFYLPARAKRSGDIIRIIRKNELKTYH